MRLFFVLLAGLAALAAEDRQVSIEMQDGGFAVRGWTAPATPPPSGWSSVFRVYAGSGDVPPLLGQYAVSAGSLTFRPKYPVSPGMRLRAVFLPAGLERTFDIPKREMKATTRVVQVYPTTSEIPENQLKLYIEFSAPMSRAEAWRHLRLLKADGNAVELPFLEIDQEMWDAESRRLTVLFDPGRIKRGVKPLEDIGPAIESGHRYTLVIDAAWRDAEGAPLTGDYKREIRVVDADRGAVDPASWHVSALKAGTSDPLVVRFREPLDWALAQRLIWVDGMQGQIELGPQEREWRFTPSVAWGSGPYLLRVDTSLEDLAGNRVGRTFDIDTFDTFSRVSRRVERQVLSIPIRFE